MPPEISSFRTETGDGSPGSTSGTTTVSDGCVGQPGAARVLCAPWASGGARGGPAARACACRYHLKTFGSAPRATIARGRGGGATSLAAGGTTSCVSPHAALHPLLPPPRRGRAAGPPPRAGPGAVTRGRQRPGPSRHHLLAGVTVGHSHLSYAGEGQLASARARKLRTGVTAVLPAAEDTWRSPVSPAGGPATAASRATAPATSSSPSRPRTRARPRRTAPSRLRCSRTTSSRPSSPRPFRPRRRRSSTRWWARAR